MHAAQNKQVSRLITTYIYIYTLLSIINKAPLLFSKSTFSFITNSGLKKIV